MASDVEVLRRIQEHRQREWEKIAHLLDAEDPTRAEEERALSSAIAALEAREAQPKVERPHHGQVEADEQCPVCKASGAKGPCPFDSQSASEAALSERVAALEKALTFVRVDLEMWLAWSETGHLKTSGPLPGENPVPEEWRSLLKMLRALSTPSKPETP